MPAILSQKYNSSSEKFTMKNLWWSFSWRFYLMTTKNETGIKLYILEELLSKAEIESFYVKFETYESLAPKIEKLKTLVKESFEAESVEISLSDELFHFVIDIKIDELEEFSIPINVIDQKETEIKLYQSFFGKLTKTILQNIPQGLSDMYMINEFLSIFNREVTGGCNMCGRIFSIDNVLISESSLSIIYKVYTCSADKQFEKNLPIMKVEVKCPLVSI